MMVTVDREIGDEDNMKIAAKFPVALVRDIYESRPVVDKCWIPEERQVKQRGKKLYQKFILQL